jgi:hypothetical protein
MKGTTSIWKPLYIAAMTFALSSAAHASAGHTFVSGLGNDANTSTNCPITAPCRSLSAVYGVTSPGGDIMMQTPGGYGSVTITGPITILGVDGAVVAAPSGGVAVMITTASATDKVTISNLVITGDGASSTTGILVTSGLLTLRNCAVKSATVGLIVTSTHAAVLNTDFIGNATAIQTNGPGVSGSIGAWLPGPGVTEVRINGGNLIDNTTVFNENDPGGIPSAATATIWEYAPGSNATGFTILMTVTGNGSGNAIPGAQLYSSTPPN